MANNWQSDYPGDGMEDEFDPEADGGLDLQTKREEFYEERFSAATRTIKRKRRFVQTSDVDDFFADYGDIAGKSSNKDSGNLLHTVVEVVEHNEEVEPEDVKLLAKRLVEQYPELLMFTNKDGYNPVHMAIRASKPKNGNYQLVDYMVSTCVEYKTQETKSRSHMECLDYALRMKAQEGRTSLHAAFKETLHADTITLLIENASNEALAAQDDLGKTPLHYAVSFSQCTDVRAKLIVLFIARDLSAVQSQQQHEYTFLDLADKSGFSVYQEHQKTRDVIAKKYDDWAAKKARAADNPSDQSVGSRAPERSTGRDAKDTSRAQLNPRDPRYVNAPKPEDRSAREPDTTLKLDDRERLRQQKKAEEAERLREEAEAYRHDGPDDRARDRDPAGRDANRNRASERDSKAQLVIRPGSTVRQAEPSPNTPLKRTNTIRVDKPSARPSQVSRKSNTGEKGNMTIWTKNSDQILLNLKLHYMRTRNAELAITFVYGTNMEDKQISFDYDGLPKSMYWNDFIARFGADTKSGLQFDKVLQYVSFPPVEILLKGRLADLEQEAEERSGVRQLGTLGRKDMKYFFDWLYKKGVRHIIRVTVQESDEARGKVHSDQAIQDSLQNFVIEHLDWQKIDLDPETILHVSSKAIQKPSPTRENSKNMEVLPDRQLKDLWLRWSGNNAVLRGWSEPEGLPLLPKLQNIYLVKPPSEKMIDNVQWNNKKIKEFQTRLNENIRKLRVVQEQLPDASAAPPEVSVWIKEAHIDVDRKATNSTAPHLESSAPRKGVNAHKWLDSTSRFAEHMIPFWKSTLADFKELRKGQGTPERIEDDVVVALIDDGVDMLDPSLSNQVLEGKSFDFHDGKVRPPFSSSRGHGTVMASMILRVCPAAKIYPIRLRTYETPDGKNQIDMKYAAQAVQAALDKKATIISMSWTLPMKDNKSGHKDKLHEALKKAVANKVLMFCSSPDKGKFTELDYPSGPWPNDFFRIGAAHADGTVFGWTPEDRITFVLPGVDVIKDQVGSRNSFQTASGKSGVSTRVVDFKYETGSSVATALAAGLAAMVIYCVKASILALKIANQNKGHVVGVGIPDDGANNIAKYDPMVQAFKSLGEVTPNNFIQVWDELDKVSEILENRSARGLSQEMKLAYTEQFIKFGSKLTSSK
ncbi:hypothetical protein BX600DRAFT_551493 [Xylariales sp. PMI_506]|nr:hypothetical protein BX600DRAFT_551493 [Xylariales sp. PMI_506]